MQEELEQEQRIDETAQPFAGAPGAPGETSTNFQIHPDTNIYTFPGGTSAFFSRPGVCYNEGGASNIGQYANFTDGNSGFLIYSENNSAGVNLAVRKKSKTDTQWSERVVLYHSGNLNTSQFASKTSVGAKADKTYVDSALVSKASQSYVDNAVANKADKSALDAKADKKYVDEKVAALSPTDVCMGFVNHSAVSCSGGVGATCSPWGGGKYSVNVKKTFSSRTGVIATPAASNSAGINISVDAVNAGSFTVSITKNGTGFDCPFYFQIFGC